MHIDFTHEKTKRHYWWLVRFQLKNALAICTWKFQLIPRWIVSIFQRLTFHTTQIVWKKIVVVCYLSESHSLKKRFFNYKMAKDIFQKYFTTKKFEIFCAKFLFYFFKVFGSATISYYHVWISEKKSWILVFKKSLIGISYNIVLIVFSIPANIISVIVFSKHKIFAQSPQEILLFTFYGILFGFGNVFTLIVFVFQQAKMASIANKIYKLRELRSDNNSTKNKFFSILLINFLFSFGATILLSLFSRKISIIHAIVLNLNIFVVFFLFIQYVIVLKIIRGFFKFINDTLNNELFSQSKLNLKLTLEKLMHSYSCVCDISQEISDFYSLPLIWAILNMFILLLWTTYNLIKKFFIYNQKPDLLIFFDLMYIHLAAVLLSTFVINVTETIKEVFYELLNF